MARTSDGEEAKKKTEKTSGLEDELMAWQAQIRCLVGRAREKARERKKKRGNRPRFPGPRQLEGQTGHIYMQTIRHIVCIQICPVCPADRAQVFYERE